MIKTTLWQKCTSQHITRMATDQKLKQRHTTNQLIKVLITSNLCPSHLPLLAQLVIFEKFDWSDLYCVKIYSVSGCSEDIRIAFNEKLVRFLSEEFMQYVQRSSLASPEKVQGNMNFECFLNLLDLCYYHVIIIIRAYEWEAQWKGAYSNNLSRWMGVIWNYRHAMHTQSAL